MYIICPCYIAKIVVNISTPIGLPRLYSGYAYVQTNAVHIAHKTD